MFNHTEYNIMKQMSEVWKQPIENVCYLTVLTLDYLLNNSLETLLETH